MTRNGVGWHSPLGMRSGSSGALGSITVSSGGSVIATASDGEETEKHRLSNAELECTLVLAL